MKFFQPYKPSTRSGFSLLELMVAVALTTLIVVALYQMFDQTQRAFRMGLNQTDIMQGGRMSMDVISRELEQTQPSYVPNQLNLYVLTPSAVPFQPLPMAGVGSEGPIRTNFIQDIFFLNRFTNRWIGLGYRVGNDMDIHPDGEVHIRQTLSRGFGTLYRFSETANSQQFGGNILATLFSTNGLAALHSQEELELRSFSNLLQPVVDGVVHLQFHAYDSHGRYLSPTNTALTNLNMKVESLQMAEFPYPALNGNTNSVILSRFDGPAPAEVQWAFLNEALPRYIEVEIGILNPSTLEQVRAIANPQRAREFLSDKAGQVQLFYQRIPIRTALR